MKINKLNTFSFLSHAKILIPIIDSHLSVDFDEKILISASPLIFKPLIVSFKEANSECITVEDLLAMLDDRMNLEFAYQEEIVQLKNNICEEFNKFCNGTNDQNFIKFVRNQRQKIVDALLNETKIEDKMVATNFFNLLMNGFEQEVLAMDRFSDVVYAILWKPLLTPFPVEMLNEIKKLTDSVGNEVSSGKIEEITSKSIHYLKEYMKVIEISDLVCNNESEIKTRLEEITQKRKVCNLEIQNILENKIIVEEFKKKCIEEVKILAETETFLAQQIAFAYEKLVFREKIKANKVEDVLSKIQRKVKLLSLSFETEGLSNLKKVAANLSELKCIENLDLKLKWNEIESEGAKDLFEALRELKRISTLNLDLEGNIIQIDGAKALSDCLRKLTILSTLCLDLRQNKIRDEGAKAISIALSGLKKIIILNLDFRLSFDIQLLIIFRISKIKIEGIRAVSNTLKKMSNISTLTLNLATNKVDAEGAKAVSTALVELTKLTALSLSFAHNKIGSNGVKFISMALKELKNISFLSLNLRCNDIEAEKTIELSAALKKLIHITNLNLNLSENAILAEGATAISASLKELKTMSV